MLSKSSGAAPPVARGHLDRARTQEGRHRKEARKAVGSRHSCKVRVEDGAERIRRANSSRVAQPHSVAGPVAPEREASYTNRQEERDSRLGHQWGKQSRSRASWDPGVVGSDSHHKPDERHGLAEESRSLEEEEASGGRMPLSDRLLRQEAVDRRTLGLLGPDGPCRHPDLTS